MNSSVTVYSDYVCPYCFFAEHLISQVAANETLTIEWMPYELRPDPQPTLRPDGEYLERVWRDSVYPMAERLGIPIKLPNISPQPHTGLAFEGYQYALSQGQGPAYTHRMFTAFFQEERNIGELSVLTELAEELRFEALDFRHALESRKYREPHRKALRHAQEEMHITAVPTLVKGIHRFQGLPSLSQLRSFLEKHEE
ncbi:MAG: DsbA family protein [Nitrospirales bacterium]|nr:DsbA family protein [Nitrospirales bacterium]